MFPFVGVFILRPTSFGKPGAVTQCFREFLCVGENFLGHRENLQMGNFCLGQRQREERQNSGSVISVDESISRKSRRNSDDSGNTISHFRLTQQAFSSDERDLRDHLERSVQQAVIGENSAQRKLYSTEYDVVIKYLERRNSVFALIESRRELESQRPQIASSKDQAQRERINLCTELERQHRLHQEAMRKVAQKSKNYGNAAVGNKIE